jgi:hypothetical protein
MQSWLDQGCSAQCSTRHPLDTPCRPGGSTCPSRARVQIITGTQYIEHVHTIPKLIHKIWKLIQAGRCKKGPLLRQIRQQTQANGGGGFGVKPFDVYGQVNERAEHMTLKPAREWFLRSLESAFHSARSGCSFNSLRAARRESCRSVCPAPPSPCVRERPDGLPLC